MQLTKFKKYFDLVQGKYEKFMAGNKRNLLKELKGLNSLSLCEFCPPAALCHDFCPMAPLCNDFCPPAPLKGG
jgi:hypothetical protein